MDSVLNIDDSDPGPPYAMAQVLPVINEGIQQHLPVMFIKEPSGEVVRSYEALEWARMSLSGFSLSKIEANIEVLARFINFYRVWGYGRPIEDGELDYLIYAYLIFRYAGTMDPEGCCSLGGLNWRPIAYGALRNEFRSLVRYLRFCATTWGYVDLTPERFRANEADPPFTRMAAHERRKESDFLAHLAAAREYWRAKYCNGDLKMPPIAKAPPKPRILRQFPPTAEVWAVIEAESNPIYKSLWLAAAFGGLRISEQLNAWQVDILPGSSREHFFRADFTESTGTILFLRADPVESRYIDDPGRRGPTRRQYLIERYGFEPRKLLPRSHPMYAGWKGTVYSGEFLTHQVFWTDDRAASLFADCAAEIRQFHRHHQTSRRHPWYYVNIADPTGEHRGNPVRIGRVEKALDDAYRRVGLEPHKWGRNIHGFRHYYKWVAEEELKIAKEHLQIMLGHRSIGSQSDYGRNAQTAHKELSSAIEHRKLLAAG
ncbi:hypothetical protein JHL17_30065 [Azospirillum sp. YIM B02556]|uniref:Tyr recombinase domain-containing protein n=1 Tax=Azospirillum endophyticum TaxID=2800326 RepID=A0ABS1FE83_9PROT|nr:hypothetical protein [Azospirillum endophyticum]MBK1841653.1 hypothetical protein [Azospirillum endophyticum]